jgi:hypothetical protein
VTLRLLPVLSLALLMRPGSAAPQNTTVNAASTVMTRSSARAMFTVASSIATEELNWAFEQRILKSPAASRLGGVWRPSDLRFQKAREALNARGGRALDAYSASSAIADAIRAEIGKIGVGPAVDAAIAALEGPAGPQIVRRKAPTTYAAFTMARLKRKAGESTDFGSLDEMARFFARRASAALPIDDPAHDAEAGQLLSTPPVADVLGRVWNGVISIVEPQLEARLNQMLVDNQAAIDQDVAAAIGDAPATAGSFPLEHMATCKESFFDLRNDPILAPRYGVDVEQRFRQVPGQIYMVPAGRETLLGLPVQSVQPALGKGDGFWVTIDAPFDQAKAAVEASIGKALTQCETRDGTRKCQLVIAEKRTLTLQSEPKGTLVGCLYFNER